MARLLLDHGAKVSPQDHARTPLLNATAKGNLEMVKLLLDRGACVDESK